MHVAVLLLCLTAAPSGADTLARVDDTTITRADLDERMRQLAAQRRPVPAGQALDDLVSEALLAREARRLGLERSPQVAEELLGERRRLASDALAESLASAHRPTEQQVREMYHATGDATRLTLVKVASRAEAAAALARIKAGGDIAAEARASIDPKLAARAGDTGFVSRVSVPAPLAAEVFKAKPGALVGPVELELGWAIARVEQLTIADEAGLAARRDAIVAFARKQYASEARQHLVAQLRARSGVKLDESFLATLKGRSAVTQAELDHVIATVNGRPLRYGAIHPTVVRLFGSAKGHGATAAIVGLANAEIDARLAGDEAIAKGLDKTPAVVAVLPGVERNILASAAAARLTSKPSLADPAVRKRVETLRAKASILVEHDKLASESRP